MRKIIIFMLLAATIVVSSVGLASCNKDSGEDSKNTAASTTGVQSNDNGDEGNINETYELLPSTSGLDFKLASRGKYYELVGIGTCTATDIFVDSYNGLPAAVIGNGAFKNNSTIKSVELGDNVIVVTAHKNFDDLTDIFD